MSLPEVIPNSLVVNRFWKRVSEVTARYHDADNKWKGGEELKQWNTLNPGFLKVFQNREPGRLRRYRQMDSLTHASSEPMSSRNADRLRGRRNRHSTLLPKIEAGSRSTPSPSDLMEEVNRLRIRSRELELTNMFLAGKAVALINLVVSDGLPGNRQREAFIMGAYPLIC
ncbi:hypothetical protein B0H19DRAFT_1061272 [Mycena capillaripes]|nr:hypothetical protein B0H19DRAFT_1061272 [Mycena capillaripes]